jgi:DNA-binding transcriptional MerR regulator
MSQTEHTLSELCALVDIPVRTARYYVQQGLVDKPKGETRAARYGQVQVEQLLLIKKWSASGVSLDRIRELLSGSESETPARAARPGTVSVVSHLQIADGLQLLIEPGRAGLTPEQVRRFSRQVMALYRALHDEQEAGADASPTKKHPS